MKKTLIALAVALGSTMAFATTPVESTPEQVKKVHVEKKHKERKARAPLTPEQFAEKKAKHLNRLDNRKKVLEGEITCSQNAKNMEDLKQCFKSAMLARKELGIGPKPMKHKVPHHAKRPVGPDGKPVGKPMGPKREHMRDARPDHPHFKGKPAVEGSVAAPIPAPAPEVK